MKCNHSGHPAAVENETAFIICKKGGKTYRPLYSPESMSHGPIENKIWLSDGWPLRLSGNLLTAQKEVTAASYKTNKDDRKA